RADRFGRRDVVLSRDLLRAGSRGAVPSRRGLHREEARLRPQPATVPRRRRAGRPARRGLRPPRATPVLLAAALLASGLHGFHSARFGAGPARVPPPALSVQLPLRGKYL